MAEETPQGLSVPLWLCGGLLLALPLVLFWPALAGGKMLWGADIQTLELVFKTAAQRSLDIGEWPFWMPEILGGMPGIAGTNLVFLYPSELLLRLVGIAPWAAFGFDTALQVSLSGLGMFLFLRAIKTSRSAALLGAFFFAASGTQVSLLFAGHINNTKAIAMIPWAFWGATLGWERKLWSGWALAGLALGLQVMGIGMQIYAYTVLGLAAYVAWMVWRDDGSWVKAGLGLGCAGLLGILISGPQLFMSLQYKPYSWREGFGYEQFTSWSFHPKEALGWVVPGYFGWRAPWYHGDWPFCLTTEYFGLLPWALAVSALAAAWPNKRKSPELFLLGLAVFSFLAGIGKHFPLHHLFYQLPVFNGFRTWTRFLCLLTFAVSALAALGWDALSTSLSERARRGALVTAAIVLFVALFSLVAADNQGPGDARSLAHESALRALGLAAGLTLAFWLWRGLRWAGALALIVALGFHAYDSSVVARLYLDFRDPQSILAKPAFLSALPDPAQGEPYRILDLPGLWQQNSGALFGYETLQGYHGVQMTAPQKLAQAMVGRQLDWLALMNTPYIISKAPVGEARLKILRDGPVWIYQLPKALPRAFLVSQALVVANDDAAFAALGRPDFPALSALTLDADPGIQPGPPKGAVHWVKRGRNSLRLRVQTERSTLLAVSQTWYPAWGAWVDGKPTPVLKADGGALQAVRLEAGEHDVELRYRTGLFKIAAVLCGLSLLALFGLLWRERGAFARLM